MHLYDKLISSVAVFPESENVPSVLIDDWLSGLPPDEQYRARTFKASRRLFQFVVGRQLLISLISARLKFAPVIVTAENGSATVVGKDIHVSVSHSGTAIVAGFSEIAPLGVDVEVVRNRSFIRLASEYFHAEEIATLVALTGQARTDKFYYYWTRKEAVAKVMGEGLSKKILGTLTTYLDDDLTVHTRNIRGYILSIAHNSNIAPSLELFELNHGQLRPSRL